MVSNNSSELAQELSSLLNRKNVVQNITFGTASAIDPALTQPEEIAQSSQWRKSRQVDFLLGRVALRRALLELAPGQALLPFPHSGDGAPAVGGHLRCSLTHKQGLAAAAVIDTHDYCGVGVDLESANISMAKERLNMLKRRFCSERELSLLPPSLGAQEVMTLFSAKESIFKAVSTLISPTPHLKDIQVDWQELFCRFSCTLSGTEESVQVRGQAIKFRAFIATWGVALH